jgi:hypothetical protein
MDVCTLSNTSHLRKIIPPTLLLSVQYIGELTYTYYCIKTHYVKARTLIQSKVVYSEYHGHYRTAVCSRVVGLLSKRRYFTTFEAEYQSVEFQDSDWHRASDHHVLSTVKISLMRFLMSQIKALSRGMN